MLGDTPMQHARVVVAVSDSTQVWALEAQLKRSREEVALVISDSGELLGLLRRDVVSDAADREPSLPVRLLPREPVASAPSGDAERWTVVFAEVDVASMRLA